MPIGLGPRQLCCHSAFCQAETWEVTAGGQREGFLLKGTVGFYSRVPSQATIGFYNRVHFEGSLALRAPLNEASKEPT